MGREMRCELLTRFFNSVDDAVGDVAGANSLAHRSAHAIPESLTNFFVDRRVAENDEFAARRHDEDEHTVAIGRADHPEALESPLRRVASASPKVRRKRHANLT